MGTHPIFESDFDCLTDMSNILTLKNVRKTESDDEAIDISIPEESKSMQEEAGDQNSNIERIKSDTEILSDYLLKREKNNIAVRKSRSKRKTAYEKLRKEAESAVALNELLRKLLSQIYRAGIVQMPPESKLLIQSEAAGYIKEALKP